MMIGAAVAIVALALFAVATIIPTAPTVAAPTGSPSVDANQVALAAPNPPSSLTSSLATNGVTFLALSDSQRAGLSGLLDPGSSIARAQADLKTTIYPTIYLGALSDPRPATPGGTSARGTMIAAFGLYFDGGASATFTTDGTSTYHTVIFFFDAATGQPVMLSGLT
jgi:hypothetical protein